ncbi:MAG TPA: hypothetical protein VGH89_27235 [Pseudonocardia sp.]|jgi:hypothetical protein
MGIKWDALGEVFVVGVGVTVVVVVLFSLGANALAARTQALEAGPEGGSAGVATATAVLCFAVCALIVAYGLYLIVS